jgi:ATP-dependent Clp protease ATP-binding subunit ClpA
VAASIPYTPRVKKVLAHAGQEAKALNHSYIGTEHILLGLLAEKDGMAAQVLRNFNVNIERCRTEILAELNTKLPMVESEAGLRNDSSSDALRHPLHIHPTAGTKGGGPYTLRAWKALIMARREADWFHHEYVGTEHLLLALLSQRDDVAVGLLQKMGVDADTVTSEIKKLLTSGHDAGPGGRQPATPLVKKALDLAIEEALALQHPKVGLKHILLGLLREGDGIAARVLTNLRIEYTVLRGLCAADPET